MLHNVSELFIAAKHVMFLLLLGIWSKFC